MSKTEREGDWSAERDALMQKLRSVEIGSPESRALARAVAEFDAAHLGRKACGCQLNVVMANLPGSQPVVLATCGPQCGQFHDFTDAERQACIERFVRGHKQPQC